MSSKPNASNRKAVGLQGRKFDFEIAGFQAVGKIYDVTAEACVAVVMPIFFDGGTTFRNSHWEYNIGGLWPR